MLSEEQQRDLQNISETKKRLEEYISTLKGHIKAARGEVKDDLQEIQKKIKEYIEQIDQEIMCLQYSSWAINNLEYIKQLHSLENHYDSTQEFLSPERNKELQHKFVKEQKRSIRHLSTMNGRISAFLESVNNMLGSYESYQDAIRTDEDNAATNDPFANSHYAAAHQYNSFRAQLQSSTPKKSSPLTKFMQAENQNLEEIRNFANRAVSCARHHAINNVPFIKEFATTTVDRLYKREDPGKSKAKTFLKGLSWLNLTRSSRQDQLKALENAITKYKEGIIDYIAQNQEQAIADPEKLKEHGQEELMKTIGKILNQIQEEKSEKEYKFGESRLESLCKKMCQTLGKTSEEIMQLDDTHKKEGPPEKPHHQRPHSGH